MRSVAAALIICCASTVPALADDRAEVEAAFAQVQAAVQSHDAATLERLLEPDYRFFHGLGEVDTRDVFVAKARDGRLARNRAAATEYEPSLRLFGDTAVRSWIIHFYRKEANLDDWGRGSAVLVRRGGVWRLASQQTSALFWVSPAPVPADLAGYAGAYDAPSRDIRIASRGRYLHLDYADGAEGYAFPAGGDVFGMGGGITLRFERGADGRILRAIRADDKRELWRAERIGD